MVKCLNPHRPWSSNMLEEISMQYPFLQCQGCSANVSCCHFLSIMDPEKPWVIDCFPPDLIHSSLNSLHLSNLSFRTGVASAAAKSQRLYSKLGSSVFAAVVLGDLEVGFLFVLERLESNILSWLLLIFLRNLLWVYINIYTYFCTFATGCGCLNRAPWCSASYLKF